MKTNKFIVVFLLLGSFTALGQIQNSLMWSFHAKGSNDISYLYGTIHIADSAVKRFPALVSDKIKNADAFYMEIDMDEANMMGMLVQMVMTENSLKDLYEDSTHYYMIKEYVEKNSPSPFALFERLKPIYFAVLLEQMETQQSAHFAGIPLDLHMSQLAKDSDVPVEQLETAEEQMQAFETMSLEDQAAALYETVKENKENPDQEDQFLEFLDLYLKQDVNALYDQAKEGDGASPEMMNNLLEKRNKRMVDRIISSPYNRIFVAVGAGHLAGDQGLIPLLREKGYVVEPVFFSFKE